MHAKNPLKVPTSLDIIPFARSAAETDPIRCPDCASPMDLQQPDPQSPYRLLGVCGPCGRWHLILSDEGGDDVLMVMLPDRDWFRAISPGDASSGPTAVEPK